MKIVIAIDSFKNCLSSSEVAEHIAKGILKAIPEACIQMIPIADGGEGSVDAMCTAMNATRMTAKVHDPLMRPIIADYAWHNPSKTAIIEMAAASGIECLLQNERNPMITTTYGTGELILAALNQGAKKIILGIGGSATNDGGTGMASALGLQFLDENNRPLAPGGGSLDKLRKIDTSQTDIRLKNVEIAVACDVSNVLTGSDGATAVFGPQKGATPSELTTLDQNLQHLAKIVKKDFKTDILTLKGGGAAGGLGAGLVAFTNAELLPGFTLISKAVNLSQAIQSADWVITGEGRIDGQTMHGKTPFGVAQIAQKYHKKVIAVAGQLGPGYENLFSQGIDSIFTISDGKGCVEDSIERAPELLESIGERIFRLVKNIE